MSDPGRRDLVARTRGTNVRSVRIGVKPGQWEWSYQDLQDSWQAAEDAGFDVISCFDHVTASPAGLAA